MRPPHECGGKPLPVAVAVHAENGFNEAPARMRGKTPEMEARMSVPILLQ